MMTGPASKADSSPVTSPASTGSTFVTAPIPSSLPGMTPTSSPQAELAASLAASIATLSTAVATLAKERRTSALMSTISSVAGTITSLAAVVETLGRSEATSSVHTRPDAPPEEKHEPPTAPHHADAQITALRIALEAVERDAKIRLHHQRVSLKAKYEGAVEHAKEDAKRQLAAKDRCIAASEREPNLLLSNAKVWEQQSDSTSKEADKEVACLAMENGRLLEEKGSLVGRNQVLVGENNSLVCKNQEIVGENERLASENKSLVNENKRLVGENQRLTYENGLHTDIHTEHRRAISANERLTAEVRTLASKNLGITDRNKLLKTRLEESQRETLVAQEGARKQLKLQKEELEASVQSLTFESERLAAQIRELSAKNTILEHHNERLMAEKNSEGAKLETLEPASGSGISHIGDVPMTLRAPHHGSRTFKLRRPSPNSTL